MSFKPTTSFSDAESALAAWLAAALAIPVFWSYQLTGFPAPPIAFFEPVSLAAIGRENLDFEYAPSAPLGQELTVHSVQWFEWAVRMHILPTPSKALGDTSAHAMMARALTDLRRDSVRDALEAAGIAVRDQVAASFTVDQDGDRWQPRGQCDLSLYLSMQADDSAGYISKVTPNITMQPG